MKNICAKNIKKQYKRNNSVILDGVSLQLHSGQCLGILGANGCGKSTLLSILAGTEPMDQGTIRTNGRIGYVPQQNPLMDELTAYDHLALWYAGRTQELKASLEDGVLSLLGISQFLHVEVRKMSGGMKKRLSIACAIADDPDILILDEPGAALDLVCKQQIENYLLSFRKRGGIIIIASHEEREIKLCDQLYILKEGTLHPFKYRGNIHDIILNF